MLECKNPEIIRIMKEHVYVQNVYVDNANVFRFHILMIIQNIHLLIIEENL